MLFFFCADIKRGFLNPVVFLKLGYKGFDLFCGLWRQRRSANFGKPVRNILNRNILLQELVNGNSRWIELNGSAVIRIEKKSSVVALFSEKNRKY